MNKREYFSMNSAELLDKVFDIYKKSFWMQVLMSFVLGIITLIVTIILTIAGAFAGVVAAMSQNTVFMFVVIGVLLLLLLVFMFVASAAGSAGCLCISKQAFYGEKINFSKAMSSMLKSLPRVTTVIIAQFLVYLPLMIIMFAGIIAVINGLLGTGSIYSLAYSTPDTTITAMIIIIIAFIAIFAFLICILSNFFIISIPISIFEKKYFFTPLKKSKLLLKKDFWTILGIRIIFGVITYIISYAASALLNTGMDYAGMLSDFAGSPAEILQLYSVLGVQYSVMSVINTVLQPLSGILIAVIYFNQKIKKEGLDIEICLEKMQLTNQPG